MLVMSASDVLKSIQTAVGEYSDIAASDDRLRQRFSNA